MPLLAVGNILRLVQVDDAGLEAGLESVMLCWACGFRHKYNLIAAELDCEIITLDSCRAVGQGMTFHGTIFAPAMLLLHNDRL